MIWLRKGIVQLLALLLLATLLGCAIITSLLIAVGKPDKIEHWLHDSGLYDHAVSSVVDQEAKSSTNDQSGSVSLKDPAVQKIAKEVFSPQLIQQNVETMLNSNYAWLEGTSAIPDFKVDLTATKQTFATQVGQAVQAYLTGLPVCTPAQTAQIQTSTFVNPLSIPCRPAGISPQVEAARATQQIETSDFLSQPVITALNLSSVGNAKQPAQPYYEQFSKAPKMYQAALKAPYILGAIALLSAIGILFIAPLKRKGLRRIGFTLTFAGIILVLIKFLSDMAFNRLEHKLFTGGSNASQLQQPLTNFFHRAQNQLTNVDLYFGVAFLLLAAVIFIMLYTGRAGKHVKNQRPGTTPNEPGTGESQDSDAARPSLRRQPPISRDVMGPLPPARTTPSAPPVPRNAQQKPSPHPRRSRLIQ